jgi:hypothetical protein
VGKIAREARSAFSPWQAIFAHPTRLCAGEQNDWTAEKLGGKAPRTLPGGTLTITRAPVPAHSGGGAKSPA